MKSLLTAIVLLLCVESYTQTSVKPQPNNAASLNQFMWGYANNTAAAGEKALIDFDAFDNWHGLGFYLSVSDDGNYFAYTINKPNPVMRYSQTPLNKVDSLVIQSTKSSWRQAFFTTSKEGFFTADGKQFIFPNNGAIWFLQLSSTGLKKVEGFGSYKVLLNKWLAYQVKGRDSLILRNLATGKEKYFAGVKDYNFTGEWLVCQNNSKELFLHDVITGTEKRYPSVEAYAFANGGKLLLLKTNEQSDPAFQRIDLQNGSTKTLYINKQTAGFPAELTLGGTSFTNDGRYIKIDLQSKPEVPGKPNAEMAGLEVWSQKDLYMQSAQSKQTGGVTSFTGIVNIETGKLVFIESDDKKIVEMKADFALIKKDNTDKQGDRFWENKVNEDSVWIVSLKDGQSNLLPTKSGSQFWFSPVGNYLIYFEANKGCHYYSYNLHNRAIKKIATNVPENQLGVNYSEGDYINGKPAAWLGQDAGVLVYDKNDVWKLDITGKQPAINVTNEFGKTNNIILNVMSYSQEIPVVSGNENLLLQAYNTKTRENGFYQMKAAVKSNPELLYMGSYFMYPTDRFHDTNIPNSTKAPIKAKNVTSWIVQRQTATDAPNYYETKDFKSFRKLTDFQPQKKYQWLTQELHSFKQLDGKEMQGILYKPENFDPSKKYPVLIVFYGAFASYMGRYPIPTAIAEGITPGNSPLWFLNNGYLVFTPDIDVEPRKYGPRAYSAIEGAAEYLKTLPYVDGNALGCAAHSWSAKLGSYIFTHSTSFAAVSMSEGFLYGNMINVALSTTGSGKSKLEEVENNFQFGNLWENKDLWLDQTTVLNVDKSTGALLLFCNKESSAEYQNQTLQFFTALRRLDKNAWWLKYDKGDHNLSDPIEIKDYTIRYTQFFDHYLKNAPAPLWMTEGIPYKLKGIESRYELDPQGKCNATNGEPCPICQAWNKQYARTPEMFKKEIKDWVLDKDIAEELERKQNERRKELDKQGEIQTREVLRMLKAN